MRLSKLSTAFPMTIPAMYRAISRFFAVFQRISTRFFHAMLKNPLKVLKNKQRRTCYNFGK